jgi:hypothetical protein
MFSPAAGWLLWSSRPLRIQQRVAGRVAHCAARLAVSRRALIVGSPLSPSKQYLQDEGAFGDVEAEVRVCRGNGYVPTPQDA